mgnify:CR=1 FL=1
MLRITMQLAADGVVVAPQEATVVGVVEQVRRKHRLHSDPRKQPAMV